ncbi:protein SPMIP2 isoform X1 [Latimeria chalumnae]|uniref:protein SPMIP2 isoform X1 n=1 Tax=Latimeria chalumnae TaxID=7897 RepID=UPI00313B7FFB
MLQSRNVGTVGQRMLFTGPDGIGDYRTNYVDFKQYIGEKKSSSEITGDLEYLYRAAPETLTPLPKFCYVGEIGWGVVEYSMLNRLTLSSGFQIKSGEFRQRCEDTVTHKYQNPWAYCHPKMDKLATEALFRVAVFKRAAGTLHLISLTKKADEQGVHLHGNRIIMIVIVMGKVNGIGESIYPKRQSA